MVGWPARGQNFGMERQNLQPLLYSRKEAAHLLSISLRSVDYMIAAGKLRTRKIGTRILIPASAVHRMAETGCPYGVTGNQEVAA